MRLWEPVLPTIPTRDLQRNETYTRTRKRLEGDITIRSEHKYLQHVTESLRALKIVTRLFKQGGANIAAQSEPGALPELQHFVDFIGAIAGLLDFKVLSLKEGNT